MKPGCRLVGLLLVALALFQALYIAVHAWFVGEWPTRPSAWLRLGLFPVALGVYLRYFSVWGHCRCAGDTVPAPARATRAARHTRN